MAFYIYENWQANGKSARIHKANCSHCNYGEGQKKNKTNANGRWHGPHKDFNEAMKTASMLDDYVISSCGICKP